MINLIDFALIMQILVLVNPLSSFPVLMSAYKSKMNVKKIAFFSVILALVIAIIIALIGQFLFNLFGVTLDSFRIAGGIILLLLGLDTIRSKEKEEKDIGKVDSLISIIATPLLTGPATISFITIKSYEISQLAIITNLLLAFLLVGIIFVLFALMIKKINMKLIDIVSRIFGLFLTAVAIQMISQGIINIMAIK
jgi:multiple antibiotic resistance protein